MQLLGNKCKVIMNFKKLWKGIYLKWIQIKQLPFFPTSGGVTALIGDEEWIEGTLIEQSNSYDSLQVHEQVFSHFLYAFSNEKSLEICMQYAILRTDLHRDFYDLKGADLDENSEMSRDKKYCF